MFSTWVKKVLLNGYCSTVEWIGFNITIKYVAYYYVAIIATESKAVKLEVS